MERKKYDHKDGQGKVFRFFIYHDGTNPLRVEHYFNGKCPRCNAIVNKTDQNAVCSYYDQGRRLDELWMRFRLKIF